MIRTRVAEKIPDLKSYRQSLQIILTLSDKELQEAIRSAVKLLTTREPEASRKLRTNIISTLLQYTKEPKKVLEWLTVTLLMLISEKQLKIDDLVEDFLSLELIDIKQKEKLRKIFSTVINAITPELENLIARDYFFSSMPTLTAAVVRPIFIPIVKPDFNLNEAIENYNPQCEGFFISYLISLSIKNNNIQTVNFIVDEHGIKRLLNLFQAAVRQGKVSEEALYPSETAHPSKADFDKGGGG